MEKSAISTGLFSIAMSDRGLFILFGGDIFLGSHIGLRCFDHGYCYWRYIGCRQTAVMGGSPKSARFSHHDLVLKPPWWIGVPRWLRKPPDCFFSAFWERILRQWCVWEPNQRTTTTCVTIEKHSVSVGTSWGWSWKVLAIPQRETANAIRGQ